MQDVQAALQARLDNGVTTLASCWKLTRRDGVVIGFTDHDRDLAFGGVTYHAGTGFTASEAAHRFDLSVDGGEISGALDADGLRESDLAAGRYDAASIETWLVDWSTPSLRMMTARATLGEVKREGAAFTVELRGLADALSQESGRLYTARCNADLGDARCRVDLSASAYKRNGSVATLNAVSRFVAAGLSDAVDGLFSGGRLVWTSGANVNLHAEVKQHEARGGSVTITLWQAMPEVIVAGDTFVVTAGCDKSFDTCRARFGNGANFRGFPHIPGNDFIMRPAGT